MSAYSSNYDSYYGSSNYTVMPSDKNNDINENYQNVRYNNRYSCQPGSNYKFTAQLNINNTTNSRASYPSKNSSNLHFNSQQGANSTFDLPVPKSLLRPPLISIKNTSKDSLINGSATSVDSNMFADSMKSAISSSDNSTTNRSPPTTDSCIFGPRSMTFNKNSQQTLSNNFSDNFSFPQKQEQQSQQQQYELQQNYQFPSRPTSEPFVNQDSKVKKVRPSSHVPSPKEQFSLKGRKAPTYSPEVVYASIFNNNGSEVVTDSKDSYRNMQNTLPQQSVQVPEHRYSVPVTSFHKRGDSSLSLINALDYQISHHRMSTNAMLTPSELNELGKINSNESYSKSDIDSRNDNKSSTQQQNDKKTQGSSSQRKKKHKFWFFGMKKKNKDSEKNSEKQNNKKFSKSQVVEDVDQKGFRNAEFGASLGKNNLEYTSDKYFASSSEINEVPIAKSDCPDGSRSASPISNFKPNINVPGFRHSFNVGNKVDEDRLLTKLSGEFERDPVGLIMFRNQQTVAEEQKDKERKQVLNEEKEEVEKNVATALSSSVGSATKRHTVGNVYNFGNFTNRKISEFSHNSENTTGSSFKNSIKETQYQDLIRRNLLSSESASSSQTNLSKKDNVNFINNDIPPQKAQSLTYMDPNSRVPPDLPPRKYPQHRNLAPIMDTAILNKNQQEKYKVKNDKGYIVFAAESESLDMEASPISKTSTSPDTSINHALTKDNTVVRRQQFSPLGTNFKSRDFTKQSLLSTVSSARESEEDPDLVYSPINETFSMKSQRAASLETVSSLDSREFTTSEAYQMFTKNAQESQTKNESKNDKKSATSSQENQSIYSELDSEFIINNDYSLAANIDKTIQSIESGNTIVNNQLDDADKTHILEPLEEDDYEDSTQDFEEELEHISTEQLKTVKELDKDGNLVDVILLDEESNSNVNSKENMNTRLANHADTSFPTSGYSSLLKNYGCDYGSTNDEHSPLGKSSNGYSDDENNNNSVDGNDGDDSEEEDDKDENSRKSLEVLHYYELNSSKSTLSQDNKSLSNYRTNRNIRNITGGSFASGTSASSSELKAGTLRVINSANETGSSSDVLTESDISSVSTMENTRENVRQFSFASSIASDVQFQQNAVAYNKIQLNLIEAEQNLHRDFSVSDSSVIYYSDSDMVRNPTFATSLSTSTNAASNKDDWVSVSENSASSSVSGASTLLSAVNSLYRDYISRKGYKNIEELCYDNSVSLSDAVRQLKIESALEQQSQRKVSGNAMSSRDSSIFSTTDSAISVPTTRNNPLSNYLQGRRNPMINDSTSYNHSYLNI